MKYINEIIRDFREDNDLRQEDVANFLKIPRSTYAKYEVSGANIDLDTLSKLCVLYRITPNDMLGFSTKTHLSAAKIKRLCKTIEKYDMDIDVVIKIIEDINRLFK